MVEIHYRQAPQVEELFAQTLLSLPVDSWWEDWMRHADRVLDDPELVDIVYQALLKRRPKSRTRGRLSTPAEVVLRLLVLKHVRNWSYGVLARELRANLVYRQFTRIGMHRAPHAKTIGKLGLLLGPAVVQQLHRNIVAQAQAEKIIRGRKLRVDTTVVETNIHYPTDSAMLGDGVRVLTRIMRQITAVTGDIGEKVRDRQRSVGHRLIEIGRASRGHGPQVQKKLEQGYRKLLGSTGQVVAQAKRFSQEIVQGVKRSADVLQQAALESMKKEIDTMLPRVKQVVSQTRARIIHGITKSEGKIVSLFEHTTEIIRKGKPGKPTEFGKMIKVQEAENQIIVAYEVYDQRPADSALLIPAIEQHQQRLGVVPRVVAGDAGFSPLPMKKLRRSWESRGSPFLFWAPKVRSAASAKRSAGSAKRSDGASAAKGASACSSDATDSAAASIKAMWVCNAGWVWESSPITSSISVRCWPHASLPRKARATRLECRINDRQLTCTSSKHSKPEQ